MKIASHLLIKDRYKCTYILRGESMGESMDRQQWRVAFIFHFGYFHIHFFIWKCNHQIFVYSWEVWMEKIGRKYFAFIWFSFFFRYWVLYDFIPSALVPRSWLIRMPILALSTMHGGWNPLPYSSSGSHLLTAGEGRTGEMQGCTVGAWEAKSWGAVWSFPERPWAWERRETNQQRCLV